MRDEQQREVATVDVAGESAVVQGRDDGLAGPGRRDDQISVTIVDGSFGVELFEHFGLIGLGVHLKTGQGDGKPVTRATPRRRFERRAEPDAILARSVELEFPVLPIGVERGSKLLEEVRSRHRGQPDVPFQAVDERGVGQVA